MPTLTLVFTNAGAAPGWTTPNGALATGGTDAVLPSATANGWLILSALDGLANVPSGATIQSVKALLDYGSLGGPIDSAPTVAGALTLDGWSPYAAPQEGAFALGGSAAIALPSVSRQALQSPTLGMMLRRGSGTVADDIRIDRARLEIVYSVVGAVMPTQTPPRVQGNQKYAYGLEATPGSVQAPDTLMRHAVLDLRPAPEYQELDTFGQFVNDGNVVVYEASTGELRGNVDYNELVLWLAMTLGKPASEEVVTGAAYRHEVSLDTRKRTPFRTVSLQKGDENVSERFVYVALRSLTLSGDKRKLQLGGTAFAKKQTDAGSKPDNGRNSKGKIHIVGGPTGGNFKLRWKGQTHTATLANAPTATNVQTALQSIAGIGAGNVLVTGTTPDFDYEFAVALGGVEQERIEAGVIALTGGTAPNVTTEIVTQGGYKEYPTAAMVGAHATIYMATTPEGLDDVANSKLGDLYEWNWGLDDKLDVQDKVDRSENGFSRMVDKPFGSQLSLGVQADTNAQALAVAARNGTGRRYVRIEFVSPQEIVVGQTGNPYAFTLDLYGDLKDLGEVSAFGETVGRRFGLDLAYSTAWGRSARAILRNAVPAA